MGTFPGISQKSPSSGPSCLSTSTEMSTAATQPAAKDCRVAKSREEEAEVREEREKAVTPAKARMGAEAHAAWPGLDEL